MFIIVKVIISNSKWKLKMPTGILFGDPYFKERIWKTFYIFSSSKYVIKLTYQRQLEIKRSWSLRVLISHTLSLCRIWSRINFPCFETELPDRATLTGWNHWFLFSWEKRHYGNQFLVWGCLFKCVGTFHGAAALYLVDLLLLTFLHKQACLIYNRKLRADFPNDAF